jgi:Tfp pilus assembly protein PilF
VTFKGDPADEPLIREMHAAAEKAIALDPLLADAHDALGAVYARDAQWGQAERSFRRAIELDSKNSNWHADYAMLLLLPLGRVRRSGRTQPSAATSKARNEFWTGR